MASDARRWPERITRERRRISNKRSRSTTKHRSSTIRSRWRTVAWATIARRNRTCSNGARCSSQPDPLRKALDELLHSALTYEKNADAAGNRGEWARPRRSISGRPWLGARRGRRRVTNWARRCSTWATGAARSNIPGGRAAVADLCRRALRPRRDPQEAGDHQQAIASFSAAVESDPVYVDARLGLADALRRTWTARTIAVGVRAHPEDRSRRRQGAIRLCRRAHPPEPISGGCLSVGRGDESLSERACIRARGRSPVRRRARRSRS